MDINRVLNTAFGKGKVKWKINKHDNLFQAVFF